MTLAPLGSDSKPVCSWPHGLSSNPKCDEGLKEVPNNPEIFARLASRSAPLRFCDFDHSRANPLRECLLTLAGLKGPHAVCHPVEFLVGKIRIPREEHHTPPERFGVHCWLRFSVPFNNPHSVSASRIKTSSVQRDNQPLRFIDKKGIHPIKMVFQRRYFQSGIEAAPHFDSPLNPACVIAKPATAQQTQQGAARLLSDLLLQNDPLKTAT